MFQTMVLFEINEFVLNKVVREHKILNKTEAQ